MRIRWYGQSAFLISGAETTVFIDPFGDMSAWVASRGLEFRLSADRGRDGRSAARDARAPRPQRVEVIGGTRSFCARPRARSPRRSARWSPSPRSTTTRRHEARPEHDLLLHPRRPARSATSATSARARCAPSSVRRSARSTCSSCRSATGRRSAEKPPRGRARAPAAARRAAPLPHRGGQLPRPARRVPRGARRARRAPGRARARGRSVPWHGRAADRRAAWTSYSRMSSAGTKAMPSTTASTAQIAR